MKERLKIDFSKSGEGSILMTQIGNSLYLDKATINTLKTGDKVTLNDKDFEPLADEIDIDSIGELKSVTNNIDGTVCIMNKINELVQAVKQINKEVKKLKEDK